MQELSMNILDIAQNSVRADASLIEITLLQNTQTHQLVFSVKDNGRGMAPEFVQKVTDPFTTTRTTRKVGLGLPFLKMAAEMTGGSLHIESEVGTGTQLTATFTLGHIDLMPLGDVPATISALVQTSPDIDFVFTYTYNDASFTLDTREMREILEGVPLSEPSVALFIRDYVQQHMQAVHNPAG